MCKMQIEVDTSNVLNLAQVLEAREDVKNVNFKYSSKPKKFFK